MAHKIDAKTRSIKIPLSEELEEILFVLSNGSSDFNKTNTARILLENGLFLLLNDWSNDPKQGLKVFKRSSECYNFRITKENFLALNKKVEVIK